MIIGLCNANLFKEVMLMNNNTLIANSIRNALFEQREKLSVLEIQVNEINALIETHKIMIEGLERSLDQYPISKVEENSSKTTSSSSAQVNTNSLRSSNLPTLCKDYTLKIKKESKVPLHGNEIAEIYKTTGITNNNTSTHEKAVRKHLEELDKEGLIYKTNPDAKRSVRFAPISRITADDL